MPWSSKTQTKVDLTTQGNIPGMYAGQVPCISTTPNIQSCTQGLILGNGGNPITSAYTVQLGGTTNTGDNQKCIQIDPGGSLNAIPASTGVNVPGSVFCVNNHSGVPQTISLSGSDTFLIYSGNSVGTGTSFVLGTAQAVTISNSAGAFWTVRFNSSSGNVISSSVSYFVCAKGLGANCPYNNDGGQVVNGACPAFTCTGVDKQHPKLTVDQVRSVVASQMLLAPVTVQLADTAGTGTDCYRPNATAGVNDTWSNVVQGYNPLDSWENNIGSTLLYPPAYIWIHGNDATSSNVLVTGSTTCAGTTPTAGVGFRFVNTVARVSGIKFQNFTENGNNTVSGGIVGMHSLLYVEDDNYDGGATGDSFLVQGARNSYIIFGSGTQTMTINNGGVAESTSGSHVQFVSPLGRAKFSVTGTVQLGGGIGFFLANDNSFMQVDGIASLSVTSTATTAVWSAIDGSYIRWADSSTFQPPAQTITYNGANLTIVDARRYSKIADACRTVGQLTCNFTSFAIHAHADTFSTISYTAGQSSTGNNVDQTSMILGSAPTISSGFGTTPSVASGTTPSSFTVNVGTGGTATAGVIAMNMASPTGWNCNVHNQTARNANRASDTYQTASTTTTVSVQNQTLSTGAAVAWTASDILTLQCNPN